MKLKSQKQKTCIATKRKARYKQNGIKINLIWVCLFDVLCKVDAPTATGKAVFKLQEGNREKIAAVKYDATDTLLTFLLFAY